MMKMMNVMTVRWYQNGKLVNKSDYSRLSIIDNRKSSTNIYSTVLNH